MTLPGHKWRTLAWKDGERVETQNEGCFDELAIDGWFHMEQMADRKWWMQIGDARVWVEIPVKGDPIVTIVRGEYEPVNGKTEGA